MGLRPVERHPSRIVNEHNNFLFFSLLEATKVPASEAAPCGDLDEWEESWSGVTHFHEMEAAECMIQIRTYYDEYNKQYSILDFVTSKLYSLEDLENLGEPTPGEAYNFIIKRGKLDTEQEEEPTDAYLAQLFTMFPDLKGTEL